MKIIIPFIISIFLLISTACNIQIHHNENQSGFIIQNDTLVKIDSYLTRIEKEKNFSGGLLIIKNGEKIFCKGYGFADKERNIKFSPTTLASMGSITKAFTAVAILKLAEQNQLSVDDSLKKYYPEVPDDKSNITIHQLLTHSAGFIDFFENDGGDFAPVTKDQFLKQAYQSKLLYTPGSKAIYSNVGMSILGTIIEKVSGKDYESYLKDNLFKSAGIINIGYHYPSLIKDTIAVGYKDENRWGTEQEYFAKEGGGPYWNLKANGGLQASLNDIFLWANAITYHRILSAATTSKMFNPYIIEEGNGGQTHFGYGCNISTSRRNTTVIDNGGSNNIYFARMIRLPQEGLVFYMVTNESSENTNMFLPNVSQLYFQGKITQDASLVNEKFRTPVAKRIYDLLKRAGFNNLKDALAKENIKVDDDMILLNVGEVLTSEKQYDKAFLLYQYYTATFPNIVVSWNELGEIYLMKKNKPEARKCFESALKLRPGNPRAKKGLEQAGI